jgi:hypothetical protein
MSLRLRARGRLGAAVLSLLCLPACSGKRGAPSPATSAAPLASVAPHPSAAGLPAASSTAAATGSTGGAGHATTDQEAWVPTNTCRVITVKGAVSSTDGGKKIAAGDPLDRPVWLDLAAGASLAVKHAQTSREVVFHGPGHVLPCEHGEERFLMTQGSAVTATWAGARPGAEVLIATPLGVVRYGDATLDVRVTERTLRVQSAVGDAVIDVGDGSAGERVPAGGHAERKGTGVDVKTLVAECDEGARKAESLARDVLSPQDSKVPLGERAKAHVQGRKAARLKCAIAAAALGTLKIGQDRDDLGRVLAQAEARWRGVPGTTRRQDPR